MSVTKSIIAINSLPRINVKPSIYSSQNHLYIGSSSSAKFKHADQSLFWANIIRVQKNGQRKSFVCNVVQPDGPPPSEPAFNAINWILGFALTVVLPFFSHKWSSLLRIKGEVDTAVQTAEDIAITVEKVAEVVDKFAEDIADDLPQNGKLRKAVEFVEDVAERASKDAQIVVDFIDEVQEAEEKLEEYVESNFAGKKANTGDEHVNHQQENRTYEPPKEENSESIN